MKDHGWLTTARGGLCIRTLELQGTIRWVTLPTTITLGCTIRRMDRSDTSMRTTTREG